MKLYSHYCLVGYSEIYCVYHESYFVDCDWLVRLSKGKCTVETIWAQRFPVKKASIYMFHDASSVTRFLY